MGEFIIPIWVQEERDLYAEFDPSGMSFSNDLVAYLSDYIEDRRIGEKVCYEIRASKPVDMERLRKTYLLLIDKLRRRNRHEITRNKASAIRLLIIGVLFILAGIFFSASMNEVISAIIATVGSFSIWEASAVWIETLPVLRKKDKILNMLSDSELKYMQQDADGKETEK